MLNSKVGFDTWLTSPGTKYITLGFRPKVIFFLCNSDTGNTTTVPNLEIGFGLTDTVSQVVFAQKAMNHSQTGQFPPITAFRREDSVMSLLGAVPAPPGGGGLASEIANAQLLSVDDTGFTLNFTMTTGTAHRFAYMAWGGDELEQVKLGYFNSQMGVSQVISGVGFRPNGCLLVSDAMTAGTNILDNLKFGLMAGGDDYPSGPYYYGASATWALEKDWGFGYRKCYQRGRDWTFLGNGLAEGGALLYYTDDGFVNSWNNTNNKRVWYLVTKNGTSSVNVPSPTALETAMPITAAPTTFELPIFAKYVRNGLKPVSSLFFHSNGACYFTPTNMCIGFADEAGNQAVFHWANGTYTHAGIIADIVYFSEHGQDDSHVVWFYDYTGANNVDGGIYKARSLSLANYTVTAANKNGFSFNEDFYLVGYIGDINNCGSDFLPQYRRGLQPWSLVHSTNKPSSGAIVA